MRVIAALALLAFGAAAVPLVGEGGPTTAGPEAVTIPPGSWDWRPAGTWRQGGVVVDAPLLRLSSDEALVVMRRQVSRGDYALCVAEGACEAADPGPAGEPQTGVSWRDATAYAAWLSERTGETWRLPTGAEWQRLAAERWVDDALGEAGFADRWLAAYEREAALAASREEEPIRPGGGWGANSLGVEDVGGNVWEWTDDCGGNGTLDEGGAIVTSPANCGTRVAEGRHRAVVIDFVRDAAGGGCATGVPPDHLGFRLVRGD